MAQFIVLATITGSPLILASESNLQAAAETVFGVPFTVEGEILVHHVGQTRAPFPLIMGVVLSLAQQCETRCQFKGFFQVEPLTAIGINPHPRLHVERQQVAKS